MFNFFQLCSVSDPQCCGSGMFIPDPIFFHPGSRIRFFFIGSGIHFKEFKYFNPKNCFFFQLSEMDPGCSSQIQIPIFYPSRIPVFGSRGQKVTGSRIRTHNTAGADLDREFASGSSKIRHCFIFSYVLNLHCLSADPNPANAITLKKIYFYIFLFFQHKTFLPYDVRRQVI